MLHANLIIRPLSAKIFYETSVLFKMDPFVRVKVGNQVLNSPTCNMGGKTPTWSNVEMPIRADDVLYIRFELWDKNKITSDDLIGYGDLEFSRFAENKFFEWIPLKRENIVSAELLVEIVMIPDQLSTLTSTTIPSTLKTEISGAESSGMSSTDIQMKGSDMASKNMDIPFHKKTEEPKLSEDDITNSGEFKKSYSGEGLGGMQAGMMQDNAGLKQEGEK